MKHTSPAQIARAASSVLSVDAGISTPRTPSRFATGGSAVAKHAATASRKIVTYESRSSRTDDSRLLDVARSCDISPTPLRQFVVETGFGHRAISRPHRRALGLRATHDGRRSRRHDPPKRPRPAKAAGDAGSVEQHKLPTRSRPTSTWPKEAAKSKTRGLRVQQARSSGSTDDRVELADQASVLVAEATGHGGLLRHRRSAASLRCGRDERRQPPPLGQRRWPVCQRGQQSRSAAHPAQPRPLRSRQQQLRPRDRADAGQRRGRHRAATAAAHRRCRGQSADRTGVHAVGQSRRSAEKLRTMRMARADGRRGLRRS